LSQEGNFAQAYSGGWRYLMLVHASNEEKAMNVGFIGLGRMGAGMAANLLKAGHHVSVYNRTPAKAQALVAQGAKLAASVAEACQGDAVITMLANDEAV
jgi:3-hydroxyisobutyrate dehydrogenase-like beta-hydroxyacid dehydrogenase